MFVRMPKALNSRTISKILVDFYLIIVLITSSYKTSFHTRSVMNPDISRHNEWTTKDKQNLKNLVSFFNENGLEIKWETVAKHLGTKTSTECYIQYMNNDNPKLNKSAWTLEEETRLLELVQYYDECYWENVAEDLGTNRTPWNCFQHYQQALNPNLVKTSEWTTEEDTQLKQGVLEHGEKNWNVISESIPGRSPYQCTVRWRRSIVCNNITEGRWNKNDDINLMKAAIQYDAPLSTSFKKSLSMIDRMKASLGILPPTTIPINTANTSSSSSSSSSSLVAASDDIPVVTEVSTDNNEIKAQYIKPKIKLKHFNWKVVSSMVLGKDENKCRERWTNYLDPTLNQEPFTSEEDVFLMKLTDKFGPGSWSNLATYFPGRTDAQLSKRWKQLSVKEDVNEYEETSKKKRKLKPSMLGRKVAAPVVNLEDFEKTLELKLD